MPDPSITDAVAAYYTSRIDEHGATPRGVDWNGAESQKLRFEQLLRVVDDDSRFFSLNDIGCGYGALADHLIGRGHRFEYTGYDLSASMIEAARERHAGLPNVRYADPGDPSVVAPADYTVASGIFNVKLDVSDDRWTEYVVETIDGLAAASRHAFAFNMLTSYSDSERMRADLYYGDPCFFFDHCMRTYGRRVALVHDYRLYEFTLTVRLGGR